MNVRNPGRGRQLRRERPFKERHLETSVDSTRSTSGSRHETRGGEIGKPRKHRENKLDEPPNLQRSRDKNYETVGKLSTADLKERGKPESGRRPDKGATREKNNALIQGRDGYRELSKGRI